VAAVFAGPASSARAQTFSIDLERVTEIYQQYYPQLTGAAVWDTTATFDFDKITVGNQRFRIPHIFTSDFGEVKTIREYNNLYVVTFRVPSVYPFASYQKDAGVFFEYEPRDIATPGLEIDFVPADVYYSRLESRSRREAWQETTKEILMARRQGAVRAPNRGVSINIPLPMPRQLESIFGPSEKTHINLSGRESITFAGETRRVSPFIGVEGRQSQPIFPSLDMNQELDVSLKGTIGDKVNVEVNHSSQAFGEDGNRVNVNYVGYEDDVIQLVELGNTSLSLPGSQLISFSAQSKGLFGVKVLAKMGPTDMTFIASKQEGEGSSASFSPTSGAIGREEERVILDIRNKSTARAVAFFVHSFRRSADRV